MNRYNAQILNDKGEYHLQFETDSREYFDAMERTAQRCMDRKPKTNFDKMTESVESLAEWLKENVVCEYCPCFGNWCKSTPEMTCEQTIKEWLNKEVEE